MSTRIGKDIECKSSQWGMVYRKCTRAPRCPLKKRCGKNETEKRAPV